MISRIEQLTSKLSPLMSEIINHPLYSDLTSVANLRVFMSEHVFAVWDFMCLLKELHSRLVSTAVPWLPPKDALGANLVGSILIGEESDVAENGSYASHFDIYLSAMEKIGADTRPIRKLLFLVMNGCNFKEAFDLIPIRPGTKNFVLTTFSFFSQPLHELAATFVYGREGITSSMFAPVLKQLELKMLRELPQCRTLVYYFKRHIELDDNEHFPKALKMLANLVGNDNKKLKEAEQAAIKALHARITFLTNIHTCLQDEQIIAAN